MDKTILLTGKRNSLSLDILEEAVQMKYKILATVEPGISEGRFGEETEDRLNYMNWNSRSPLSARSVLLHGKNLYGSIDEVIIVFSPDGESKAFHEISSANFENRLDSDIKGFLFLLKETIAHFQKQRGGVITVVEYGRGQSILSPLDSCIDGAFTRLIDSLFTFYQNEPLILRGFSSRSEDSREFAKYILTAFSGRDEKSAGKWHKFSDKTGLFSFGR
jgi:hypothetical protein